MKKLSYALLMFFSLSAFATDDAPKNRVSASVSAWPPFNMAILTHAGLTYDRILSDYVAISAGGNFELMGHMHGYLVGGGADVGAKVMLYNHGDYAFEKGVVAGISAGMNLGESYASGGDPRETRQRRFFEMWFPLSLQLDYIYTWKNHFFFGGGVKSQLFYLNYTRDKETVVARSNPYPRLELIFGFVF